MKASLLIFLVLIPGRLFAAAPDIDNPDVLKRYAELAYHVATHLTSHHELVTNTTCGRHGTMTRSAPGINLTQVVFVNCFNSSQWRPPVTDGVLLAREINDDVTIMESKNIVITFDMSKTGYTVNGVLKEGAGADTSTGVTNIGDVDFIFNLKHENWAHVVKEFQYTKEHIYSEDIHSQEMFKITLTGKPYGTLVAETIEPISMGTGNKFGQIVSGKFTLTHGNRKVLISFVKPREILVEETGKRPRRIDWYGDPTIIYSKVPYELRKHF